MLQLLLLLLLQSVMTACLDARMCNFRIVTKHQMKHSYAKTTASSPAPAPQHAGLIERPVPLQLTKPTVLQIILKILCWTVAAWLSVKHPVATDTLPTDETGCPGT
jgi:hypothetical protein